MTIKKLKSLLILVLFYASAAAFAVDRHVSPTGNDANPGTAAQPWRTLAKAGASAVAGDTVYIHAGTYYERLAITNSGTQGAPIVFQNYGNDVVTISGRNISLSSIPFQNEGGRRWYGTVDMYGVSWIQVRGLRVVESHGNGIFGQDVHHIVVENNYVDNYIEGDNWSTSGIGFLLAGVYDSRPWDTSGFRLNTDVTIRNNEVTRSSYGRFGEIVSLEGVDGFLVDGNYIHGNYNGSGGTAGGGENIDAKRGSRNGTIRNNTITDSPRVGIYVEAWDYETFNIDIYNNKVFGLGDDGIRIATERGGAVHDIRIYNNLVYNNGGQSGLEIPYYVQPEVPTDQRIYNVKIYNNTFVNNHSAANYGVGISIAYNPLLSGIEIANNVVNEHPTATISVEKNASGVRSPGVTVTKNLQFPYRDWWHEHDGGNAVKANPQFVSAAGSDYHLAAGSPAIDAGAPSPAASVDIVGTSRPQGAGVDIGAYERPAGTPPPGDPPPSGPRQQAENGTLLGMATVQSTGVANPDGGAFVGNLRNPGDGVRVRFDGVTAGNYTVTIRYHAWTNQENTVVINGVAHEREAFSPTADGWGTKTITGVTLGTNNTIAVVAGWGFVDIDYIEITSGSGGGGGTLSDIKIQAESGTPTGAGVAFHNNEFAPFEGTGYMGRFDTPGEGSDRLALTFPGVTAGTYTVRISYQAWGEQQNDVLINGTSRREIFPPTGGAWGTKTLTGVVLPPGQNVITIVKAWGYINVDYVRISQ